MIKASNRFKAKLRRTLQDTAEVLELPELSPLQRHYYGDIWELLQRLQGMLYVLDEAEEINLKTNAEIMAEIEEETREKLHEAQDRERRERETEIVQIDLELFMYARRQRYTLGDKFYRKFALRNAMILDYGKTYGTEAQERLRKKMDDVREKFLARAQELEEAAGVKDTEEEKA